MTVRGDLDESLFAEMKDLVTEVFPELTSSKLTLRRPKSSQTEDPIFGHPIAEVDDSFQLRYTQRLSTRPKQLGPERVDFTAEPQKVVYIATKDIEDTLPDGRLHREQDIIVLLGVEYEIEAITTYPQYHNTSIMHKLTLNVRSAPEQDQS